MGTNPTHRGAALIRSSVLISYEHMRLTLDHCLHAVTTRSRGSGAPLALVYPQERKRA